MSQSMFEFHGIKSNFEFVLWHFLNFFPALSLQNRPTLQNTDSNSISLYSENNAYLNIHLYMINSTKYTSNKNAGSGVLVWKTSGFCGYGDSVGIPTGFCCGYGDWNPIPTAVRQPCNTGFYAFYLISLNLVFLDCVCLWTVFPCFFLHRFI